MKKFSAVLNTTTSDFIDVDKQTDIKEYKKTRDIRIPIMNLRGIESWNAHITQFHA